MIKQVIVMRKDLNMRKGKMIAQGAHASMKVLLDRVNGYTDHQVVSDCKKKDYPCYCVMTNRYHTGTITLSHTMHEWVTGIFTKICVSVNSEEELLQIYKSAAEQKIPCALIKDNGLTEFKGVPTNTCCAIGPDEAEKIDAITGDLKLL